MVLGCLIGPVLPTSDPQCGLAPTLVVRITSVCPTSDPQCGLAPTLVVWITFGWLIGLLIDV